MNTFDDKKKLIQLTREDYQRALQQAEMIKQWAAEMAVKGEAPLALISVNSQGQRFIRMMQGVDFKKVAEIMKHLSEQIKFMQPAAIKPN